MAQSRLWHRLVLVVLGGAVFSIAQEMESLLFSQKVPVLGIGSALTSAVSLSYVVIATRSRLPKWINTYVLATSLVVLSYYSLLNIRSLPYLVDTAAVSHYAAEMVLQGKNPYASFDMHEALNRFGLESERATLLEDGSIENRLNYPAGSFLFLAPFVALGLGDTRAIYLACLGVMALALHFYARPDMKNVVVLYVVANMAMLRLTYAGLPEPLWALPTLVAWLTARRRWSSALALGVATTIKQLAWFFAPFYLVMVFREFGFRDAIRRAALILGVFAVVNLPFVVSSPVTWVQGILGPMADPLVPMGGGLIALSTSGVVPTFSKIAYTLIEIAALFVSLAWYFRSYRSYKSAGVILPTLPLWFAWRSLLGYFYMGGFLLLGIAICCEEDSTVEKVAIEEAQTVGEVA